MATRSVEDLDCTAWTTDIPAGARRIRRRHGSVLTAARPHRSFGKDLTGHEGRLDLQGGEESGE
ncbi:hypothetical protein ACWD0J_09455 [Streptomyces sp. NPDC003011]